MPSGRYSRERLLLALGIDAEAAGGEPEVPVVVKYHGKKILRQLLAERGLCRRLDVDVKHLFKLGKDIALFVSTAMWYIALRPLSAVVDCFCFQYTERCRLFKPFGTKAPIPARNRVFPLCRCRTVVV